MADDTDCNLKKNNYSIISIGYKKKTDIDYVLKKILINNEYRILLKIRYWLSTINVGFF